jgi:adenine-specific DNA-methyltransferase
MPTLDWIGKKAVLNHHNEVPFHLLRCNAELSVGDDSNNLLVQGDNLLALKALLPYYAGQVKCIYIDPPYNTGNENWVYNDNVNSPEIREWLGKVVGSESEDLSRHDKWLCMMYPRLILLKQFLRNDGVIFISIDDFEASSLKLVMDEIFGRPNFIAQLVWEKGRKNDAKFFSVGHEYMLVYASSIELLRNKKTVWREPKPGAQEIWDKYLKIREEFGDDNKSIEQALVEWYKQLPIKHPAKALSRYKHIDKYGPWRDRDISWPGGNGPRYDVLHPLTKKPCKIPDGGWRFATPEAMQKQILLGLIEFREDHTQPPFRKAHLHPIPEELDIEQIDEEEEKGNEDNIGLQVMPSVIYKQSQVAIKYLRRLMGGDVFENPKDYEVIARLLRYVTEPGDIILDSFAGSGTTGHAVLDINSKSNYGRKFILVEMEPSIAQKITFERLKRISIGYEWIDQKGNIRYEEGLGGGFRYCELGPTLFDADGQIRPEVKFADLAAHVYFTETGQPLPASGNAESPLLGVEKGTAVYLLYNGIMRDQGNTLTLDLLNTLPVYTGPKVIYADGCKIGHEKLRELGITFKQIPYEVKVR